MNANLQAMQFRHSFTPGDLGAVIRMHGVVYAREQGWDHTFEGYVAEGIGRFAILFDPAWERLWLAEHDGELVGSIAIVRRDQDTAQLRWFLIAPSARRSGVGRRLLQEALSFCRSREYTAVVLETAGELMAAANLYHEFGFELIEESASRQRWGALVTNQQYLLNL